jgi:thioredoxin reductase (NADPH)
VQDYEVVVVGGGPAGLTAGLHLARAGRRALLLEKSVYGGNLENVEWLEDDPAFPGGIAGAQRASDLAEAATAAGLEVRNLEVTGLELFSSTRWVACEGGQGFSAQVVVLAGGTRFRKLGVPGEAQFSGRGVIECTPCDGGLFLGRTVAVYGSGDHARADARTLSRFAARLEVLDPAEKHLVAVLGSDRVEGLELTDVATGRSETMAVDGVAIRAGSEPITSWLDGLVELAPDGRIVTGAGLETSAAHVLAAGDIRAGSQPRVAAAVGDGEKAASRALEQLKAG